MSATDAGRAEPAETAPATEGMAETAAVEISYEQTDDGEEWVYAPDDDVRTVDVVKTDDDVTQVIVGAAEFVREEPLESRLRAAVLGAILAVDGVDGAYEEDREVWTVDGDPSGDGLVRAVAAAVDEMYDDLAAHVDGLG